MTVIFGRSRHIAIPALVGVRVFSHGGTASSNWWEVSGVTCVAAYQAKGAADLAASYVNLANPGTYDLTTTDAPLFNAATGWNFDDGTDYLDTGFVPTSTMSAVVRYASSFTGGYHAVAGAWDGSSATSFIIMPSYATKHAISWANRENSTGSYSSTGVMALTPSKGYLDGTPTINNTGTWSGTESNHIWIGCYNKAGVVTVSYASASSYILAAAFYASALSDDQVSSLTTAINAL